MRATSGWLDKGRQCMVMVAVAALAVGWTTMAAAAEGSPTGTGQTTCFQLERYPAGHVLGPDLVSGEPGQIVFRDPTNNEPEFLPDGSPNPAYDPSLGVVQDNPVPCTGTGQDGEKQMGLKLRYSDRGDGRITDRNTGLTWAKKSYDRGFHDKDNIFTWDQAFEYIRTMNNTCHLSQIAPGPNAPAPTSCVDNTGCPAVGDRCGFAGKRDWRLPNIKELGTLVNYGIFSSLTTVAPTVHPVFNTNCAPGVSVLTGSCTHADSITNDEHGDLVPVGFVGAPVFDPLTGQEEPNPALPVPYTYWSSTTGDAPGDAWFMDYTTGDAGAHFKEADIDVDVTLCEPNCGPTNPPLVAHAGFVRAVRGGESGLDQDDDRRE